MSNLFMFNKTKFSTPCEADAAGELHAAIQHIDAIDSYFGGEGDNAKIEIEEAISLALRCAGLEPNDFVLAVRCTNDTNEKYVLLSDCDINE
jgi:hypothetical protein